MAENLFIHNQEDIAMKMDENPDLEVEGRKNLTDAFDLYKEVVELFPDSDVIDGALYMMRWCYSDAESDLYDADKSAEYCALSKNMQSLALYHKQLFCGAVLL